MSLVGRAHQLRGSLNYIYHSNCTFTGSLVSSFAIPRQILSPFPCVVISEHIYVYVSYTRRVRADYAAEYYTAITSVFIPGMGMYKPGVSCLTFHGGSSFFNVSKLYYTQQHRLQLDLFFFFLNDGDGDVGVGILSPVIQLHMRTETGAQAKTSKRSQKRKKNNPCFNSAVG